MAKVRVSTINTLLETSESTHEVANLVNAALLNRERWIVLTVADGKVAVIAEDITFIRD